MKDTREFATCQFNGYDGDMHVLVTCHYTEKLTENGWRCDNAKYECEFADDKADIGATVWLDKDGNTTLNEWDNGLTEDEASKSPRLAAMLKEFHEATEYSHTSLAGQACLAIDECIGRMGEDFNAVMVETMKQNCSTYPHVRAFWAREYDCEDHIDDCHYETFESVDKALAYYRGIMARPTGNDSNAVWKRDMAEWAVLELNRLV